MRQIILSLVLSLSAIATLRADAPAAFDVGTFKFQRPAGWEWIDIPEGMKMMRKAQFAVPGKDGAKPAEVIFYHFGPSQGGDTAANVTRWVGQFSDKKAPEKSETVELAGTKVTFVSVAGTYQSGMPMGPKTPMTGYALLGAILEDNSAGSVFIKMTGPEAVVKEADAAFRQFVASAKK